MLDILKITLVFATILIFLRFKWSIGYVMFVGSGLLFLLYRVPFPVVVHTVDVTVTDAVTIKLFFALTLIRVLEMILREKNVMNRMMEATRVFLRKKKVVIVSMPMLIGLLPSLGGAYFSAPMVEESTRGLTMSPEEKGFINYWFRHPWEYVLPLYPGILLASAVTGIELRSLILANSVYAALVVITGILFGLKGIRGNFGEDEQSPVLPPGSEGPKHGTPDPRSMAGGGRLIWSFLPIFCILFLVIVVHVELHYSLGIVIAALFLFYRSGRREILRALRYGFTPEVFVLIIGTMLFKFAMEGSGAVGRLNQFFALTGIPLLPVLLALPFLIGLLTGLTMGFVGSTFPLIVSMTGGAHLGSLTLAFASGFFGVLLSPVHLCLVLTREYFKADVWGIYKRIIPAGGVILLAALIEYMLL